MERLLIAVALGAVAAAVAVLATRRSSGTPGTSAHTVPAQVRRSDFVRAEAPWLVAVFASATCDACAAVWAKAQLLEADEVAVQRLEAVQDAEIHRRYSIDAVPLTLVIDHEGVVEASFLGPVSATDLWAAVARLRTPDGDIA